MLAETRYARNAEGAHIAYQAIGDGPFDLVLVPGFISHVEAWSAEPEGARFLRGLAAFSRVVLFDKRGTGLSDRLPHAGPPSLEQRIDDIRVVLDAIGSRPAALLGFSEGAGTSVFFAATYPERVTALVLFGGSPSQPWGKGVDRDAVFERFRQLIESGWGRGCMAPLFAPGAVGVSRLERWVAYWERASARPGEAFDLLKISCLVDVRDVLPSVRAPTLVVHRTGDLIAPISAGRYFAKHIPGATFKEHPGDDHMPFLGDSDAVVADIEEFLTGHRSQRDPDHALATILFTDIVGSTERAAELGDRRWRALLDDHDAASQREIERHRGRLVKSTGDGVLAVFDGPARAVHCAAAMGRAIEPLGVRIRAGLHIGDVQLRGSDVGGVAVHAAARIMSAADPGEVLVSSSVKDLVAGTGIDLVEKGAHTLKGVPGEWRLFSVANERRSSTPTALGSTSTGR
jgi:class 3 adenylate cyclase/pimeloyl-ACP methyl ester carboxylesterase